MKKKLLVFSPLIIILGVCLLLLVGLQQDPKKLASALIGKPVPEFYQTNLLIPSKTLTNKDLPKEPHLINIWGSWCHYCKEEHPFLMELAGQGVKIIGLNYRDKAQSAVEFLHKANWLCNLEWMVLLKLIWWMNMGLSDTVIQVQSTKLYGGGNFCRNWRN